ncbi:MAG: RNHCP domain-containing protein [Candidatus Jorgensenbacteria bacterium]|nr:RNHCP domain-containing protein [Candidatus Jorgensenbacteria bacterium]
MTKTFKRNKENFTCEHCGNAVTGNGYTNHCPKCLWSKHVDENPGDRNETCGGMMRPKSVVIEKREFIISHECEKCGVKKRNKAAENDDLSTLLSK